MYLDKECVGCIIDQSLRVAKTINADKNLTSKIYQHVTELSKNFSFTLSPPEVATPVYQDMSKLAQKIDLYKEVKQLSTQKAKSYIPYLQNYLKNSKNIFFDATKIAVAGNVIDLATPTHFDLHDELNKIFDTNFAIDNTDILFKKLQNAKIVVYLADNAGEHIFDKLYIQTLLSLFPNLNIYYLTRDKPIINDITYNEVLEDGFNNICNLVNSGVSSPGFLPNIANKESIDLYTKADVIISKGMGNYETLSEEKRDIFFLLKVKCSVVAKSLSLNVGDIVCKI